MSCLGIGLGVAAASIVGLVVSKELTKDKSKSSNSHPPSPLTFTGNASSLFHYLVILSYCKEEDMKNTISDVGFIVHSNEETSIIWGLALFMYKEEPFESHRRKILRKGKVSVVLQYPGMIGRVCEGLVLDVDYSTDLLLLEIKNPNGKKMPTANLAQTSFSGTSLYSLDLLFSIGEYRVLQYGVKQNLNHCGMYFHIDPTFYTPYPGVCLNSDMDVIGLKIGRCRTHNQAAHVLGIEYIADRLELSPLRSSASDIRFCVEGRWWLWTVRRKFMGFCAIFSRVSLLAR